MSYNSKKTSECAERPDPWSGVWNVASMTVYRRDVTVKYTRPRPRKRGEASNKKEVKELSKESLKRLAFVANNTDVDFTWMVTLTYPSEYPTDGAAVKSHLNAFLTWARYKRRGISYLWFLEFQKRGAPHFHVLTTWPLDRKKVSERWYKIVASGDDRHLRAGTRVEKIRSERGAANYVTKYATKAEQKETPSEYLNVGRFWGHSRDVKPVERGVLEVAQTKDEFIQALSFWDYVESVKRQPLTTLYNLSETETMQDIMRSGEDGQ